MGHKYLKQFNLIKNFPNSLLKFDKRRLKWLVQRIKYGIDERATWDLDNTFYAWLYEHLCAYKQYAPIDLDYHTCEYEGVTYTQGEIIDCILDTIEYYFSDAYDSFDNDDVAFVSNISRMWSAILPYMWW